jgi:hypothetical protein
MTLTLATSWWVVQHYVIFSFSFLFLEDSSILESQSAWVLSLLVRKEKQCSSSIGKLEVIDELILLSNLLLMHTT